AKPPFRRLPRRARRRPLLGLLPLRRECRVHANPPYSCAPADACADGHLGSRTRIDVKVVASLSRLAAWYATLPLAFRAVSRRYAQVNRGARCSRARGWYNANIGMFTSKSIRGIKKPLKTPL